MKVNSSIIISYLSFIVIGLTLTPFNVLAKNTSITITSKQLELQSTPQKIDKKLSLADKNRRDNPVLFKSLLEQLHQETSLTDEQQQFLNLLDSYHLTFVGKYALAEKKLKKILNSKANEITKFRANYSLITTSMAKQQWLEGIQYLTLNIKALKNIKDPIQKQNGLLITIIFYNQIGQYQLALDYLEKLAQQNLSAKNTCWLKQLTLEVKFKRNEITPSDPSLGQAMAECAEIGNKINENLILTYKAKLYLNAKKPNKTLELTQNKLEDVTKLQYPLLTSEMANLIGLAYWQKGDINNAKIFANKALSYNPKVTNLVQGEDTLFLLYNIAKHQNNSALALSYFEKYSAVEREQLRGEKAKHLAFQLAQHKSLEQESKIELLREKNALLVSEQALAKIKVENIQLFIAILTITIALLLLWAGRLWKSHKRVKQLAEYDTLTGIFSRGHFTQVTTSALSYCKNAEQPLSLIMFDLDFFKKVNDNFGHACGDWVLKEVVRVCQATGRKNDIFARLGGEEFCLVLPSCQLSAAIERAEACRAAIESINTSATGHNFSVSASFGVTDAKHSGYALDKLLANADLAAYQAKHNGRNKVSVYK